jgi:hypothetical protein
MPIRTSQPEASTAASHPAAGPRLGSVEIGMHRTSTEELLPFGALPAPAPVPAPERALALDAMLVSRALRDPKRRPARWQQPSFGAEVELIRRHLAPVRSRRVLASSFGREAFHVVPTAAERDDPSPIRLAYALRWMELGGGSTGPAWPLSTD